MLNNLYNTINNTNTITNINRNYSKTIKKDKIDYIEANIVDNIIHTQELRARITEIPDDTIKLLLKYDSLYLHLYIHIVFYIFAIKCVDINYVLNIDNSDTRTTLIHRNIINDMFKPFYIHNKKTTSKLRVNTMLEKISTITIYDETTQQNYIPFKITPYTQENYRNNTIKKTIFYKMEYNKIMNNNYVDIKNKEVNFHYTKLPKNLYYNTALEVKNNKELQYMYNLYVATIQTNTNNKSMVYREKTSLIKYLPSYAKTLINNKVYLRRKINENNYIIIENAPRNKSKIKLLEKIEIDRDDEYILYYK